MSHPNRSADSGLDTASQAAFWDAKILDWESDRYGSEHPSGVLENLVRPFSQSIAYRLRTGRTLLAPQVRGARILELGCGSALLAEDLIGLGANSYVGIDFAPSAIHAAAARLAGAECAERARVQVGDVVRDELPAADIVFSLGLLDWLPDDAIDRVLSASGPARFLHIFSERRPGLAQLMHRLYVSVAYGWRSGGYVPRYLDLDRVLAVPRARALRPVRILRDPALSFGAVVTDLEPAE